MQRTVAFLVFMLSAALPSVHAEEGMWLPDRLPVELLKAKYGFEPTSEFTELLRKAVVRFPNGTGSFVSSDGLALTNHHIAIGCAAKLSTAEDDIVGNAFVARSRDQERPCPGLELDVLESLQDITRDVNAAVHRDMSAADAANARRARINDIESMASRRSGLTCENVTLFNGAEYHLYCYRKYTDVRLVFIPEVDVARFGGDPDNFEFPRWDLDKALLRAYENGAPARPAAHFAWRDEPLREGELVFVAGHPGRTERLITSAEARFLRDTAYPTVLNILRRFEISLQQYGYEGKEQARIADDRLFGFQNARKAYTGELAKLQDPSFMAAKMSADWKLLAGMKSDPALDRKYGGASDPWKDIASAVQAGARIYPRLRLLERGNGFQSTYFGYARTIVRLTQEREKPNAQRLREYSDAAIPSVEQELFADVPVHDDMETALLGESLSLLAEMLGGDDPLVLQVLRGKSPRERAYELVSGTRLKDAAFRRSLVQGGSVAVGASNDPMIQLAMLVDPESRAVKAEDDRAQELKRQGYAKLVGLMQALGASAAYPDATFTLRISIGTVAGYEENGKQVPFATDFTGLYMRSAEHENLRPWKLPRRWSEDCVSVGPGRPEGCLDRSVQFNFVSTNDITGGNSGSPVLDRQGRVVGLIFDGNIQSLGNEFAYSETQARAVSVSAAGIREALRTIYDAAVLADELGR